MRWLLGMLVGVAAAVPAYAETVLEKGFAGALRGCEEWILNPASWDKGTAPFIATVGLGNAMALVPSIDDAAQPPAELRAANHYWRINSTPTAGYILVVSDRLPMCHITGGGRADLQPLVEAVLASSAFQARWTKVRDNLKADMASTIYRNREDPALSITISRAKAAGQRQDLVQVLATATFELKH